jgi:hypothetical protein
MALFVQQFRVTACQQNVDTSGNITSTSAVLTPVPGGASTGTLTAATASVVSLILAGAEAVTVGSIFTVTIQ